MQVYRDDARIMDFTEKMQWFFFFEATDPEFRGTYREEDMLSSAITAMPLPGRSAHQSRPSATSR